MINFKELIKERDEMQAKLDETKLRIENLTMVKDEVPDWLWEEESTYKAYQESLINRIGSAIAAEDIAGVNEESIMEPTESEDIPSSFIEDIMKAIIEGEEEDTEEESQPQSPFDAEAFLNGLVTDGLTETEHSSESCSLCGDTEAKEITDEEKERLASTIANAIIFASIVNKHTDL